MPPAIMPTPPHVPFEQAVRTFARIGLLSFGGPAAQIAVMHRILVDEKRWLSEEQFLHALNFCMLLPGPEAMQLATYAGWKLHGVRGGLVAGLLFIVPGFLMMLALSALYVLHGDAPLLEGIFFGLKAAVLAVVAQAVLKVAGRALKTRFHLGIAIAAFLLIFLFKAPFPLIVFGAGVLGVVALRHADGAGGATTPADVSDTPSVAFAATARTVATWLAVWFVPLGLLWAAAPGSVFVDAAAFFSKVALVTFGGAYAVLAYVGQQAVEAHGWLTAADMLAGLGLAETTLGPLVLVLIFVGFLAGASLGGLDPLIGGLLGGTVALWFTFAPCFLFIFAGAPHVERLRHVRWLRDALSAITAAVVGVIANLGVWFGLHVLFARYGETQWGPLVLPTPDLASFAPAAFVIALASGLALMRLHVPILLVLAGAAVAGLAVTAM